MSAPTDPAPCVYPGCRNSRRTRGLCNHHYQTARSYIRDGKTTEAELESRGLMTPKGTGNGAVDGHAAFLDPDARGDA